MRTFLTLIFIVFAAALTTGCSGGRTEPVAPEGYVDPGTDVDAMSEEMSQDAPQ